MLILLPMTTGIFLKIVAQYNYENLKEKRNREISPFWRIIEPKSKLAEKLSFGKKFIIENRIVEKNRQLNINFITKIKYF